MPTRLLGGLGRLLVFPGRDYPIELCPLQPLEFARLRHIAGGGVLALPLLRSRIFPAEYQRRTGAPVTAFGPQTSSDNVYAYCHGIDE